MSDDTGQDFDSEDEFEDEEKTPAWYRKDSQRAANAAKAAKAEATAAKRELLLMKAGVDTSTPVGSLFAKAYDGGLDIESVKSEWEKLSPSSAPQPVSAPEPDVTSRQAANMLRDGERAAPVIGSTGETRRDEMLRVARESTPSLGVAAWLNRSMRDAEAAQNQG